MNKFGRKKIALALVCALVFGGKTQAMNTIKNGVKNPQTLEAVGGEKSYLLPVRKLLNRC